MIKSAAILGGGVIGGGWVARLIENGITCRIYDPDPEAARKVEEVLAGADRAYSKLTLAPRGDKAAWAMASTVAEACEGA
ncbi:MAG: 3-hydroxyacyl-CoA dehydrogenase NAD-binding domain-containing protein, partial [Pseudomonadota bacterium]